MPNLRHPTFLAILAAAVVALPAHATDTSYWTHTSPADFAEAVVQDLVITSYGEVQLTRRLETLAEGIQGASIVHALAESGGGVWAATGPEGVLVRVEGEQTERFEIPGATNLLSLLAEPDGSLLIGTGGGQGRVLRARVENGDIRLQTVFAEEGVEYVWKIARHADGTLYVATGPGATLYEVRPDGQSRRIFSAAGESNLLSMLLTEGDEIFLGTDPNGLVWSVNRRTGRGQVLFDAGEPEITALVRVNQVLYALGGSRGAGVLEDPGAGRPSVVGAEGAIARQALEMPEPPDLPPVGPDRIPLGQDPEAPRQPPEAPGEEEPEDRAPAARPDDQPRGLGPPIPDFLGDGSALYRLELAQERRGLVTGVLRDPALMMDMIVQNGRLLIAAGDGEQGQLYQLDLATNELVLLAAPDAMQVASLWQAPDGQVILGIANPGSVLALGAGYAPEGTLTIEPLDAGAVSRFGTIQLNGRVPAGTEMLISARSGNTADPELDPDGWGDWSDPQPARRFLQTKVDQGRFFQYRLTFRSDGAATPGLERVRIAYQLPNLAPQISSLEITSELTDMEVPEIVANALEANEPPSSTRIISWDASDPNGDPLTFDVYLRRGQRGPFERIAADLTEPGYAWDTRTHGDGLYEVRVVASDARGNPPGSALRASRISELVEVDLTPPTMGDIAVERHGEAVLLALRVVDMGGIVARLEYLLEGDPAEPANWIRAFPEDMIADSPQERYVLELRPPPGAGTLRLRAVDDSGNIAYQTLTLGNRD